MKFMGGFILGGLSVVAAGFAAFHLIEWKAWRK